MVNTDKIQEFVDKLATTGTTLLNNAPDYIKEYLRYCMFHDIWRLCIGLALLAVSFVIYRNTSADGDFDVKFMDLIGEIYFFGKRKRPFNGILVWTVFIFCFILGIVETLTMISYIIELINYPDVYLIHALRGN